MLKEQDKLNQLPAHVRGYIDSAKPQIVQSEDKLFITIGTTHAYAKDWFEDAKQELNKVYGTRSCEIHVSNEVVTKAIEEYTIDYTIIDTIEKFEDFLTILENLSKKVISLDFETTSINTFKAEILGIGISTESCTFYLPIISHEQEYLPLDYIMMKLSPVLKKNLLVVHNAKYELKILARHGLLVSNFFDTMLACYLDDSSKPKGLKPVVKRLFNRAMTGLDELMTDARKKLRAKIKLKEYSALIRSVPEDEKDSIFLKRIPMESLAEYCAADAYYTYQLYEHYQDYFDETRTFLLAQDHRLLTCVIEMEQAGVLLNGPHFKRLQEELPRNLNNIKEKLYRIAGREFNISSSKQLGEILYVEMNVAGQPMLTDKGNFQTDEKTLKFLVKSVQDSKHEEFLNLLLKYRELNKLITTYLKLTDLIEESTGRLHGSFNSCGTTTGRFSSQRPNMQNLPKSGLGKAIRQGIICPDGYKIIAADYSQIELRILAHLTQDTMLINAFNRGEDIHSLIASRVFGIPLEEVTEHQRNIGKTGNYAAIYGSGARKFAETTGMTVAKATHFMEKYFEELPNLKQLLEDTKSFARNKSYVETMTGRRRYIQGMDSPVKWKRFAAERECFNSVIQGTAADIMRAAIINVNEWLKNNVPEAKIIMTVHDELVIETPAKDQGFVVSNIKNIMEWPKETGCKELYPPLDVPLEVDIEVGDNYAEAK